MFNDAHLRLGGVFAARSNGPALRAILGVIQAGVITRQTQHGGCNAHANTGLVHHVEHAAQALARLAHQIADGACPIAIRTAVSTGDRKFALAKIQQGIGGAAPAQLMVQTRQRNVVAHAGELPVQTNEFLGHDEQGNAPGARHQRTTGIGNFGQYQMDDVFTQFMLATGDPHLVALEPVARTQRLRFEVGAVGHCAGGDVGQAGAGLRLAQAHGAAKATIEFIFCEHRFLQFGAVHHQQIGIARGEHARADADRSTGEKCVGRGLHAVGQLHSAHLKILGCAEHARLGIRFGRVVGGLGKNDFFAIKTGLFDIDQSVEGRKFFARNALAGVQHRIKGLARMVSKTGTLRQLGGMQPVVEQKVQSGTEFHGDRLKKTAREGLSTYKEKIRFGVPQALTTAMVPEALTAKCRSPSTTM